MMFRPTFRSAVLAFFAMTGASNAATELITNGGFESGLSPWVCDVNGNFPAAICAPTQLLAHSGNFSLVGYDTLGVGSVTQSIVATAGQKYIVDFWVATLDLFDTGTFGYSLDGGAATELSFAAINTWYNVQTSFVASGPSADISFLFNSAFFIPATLFIDDVSVTAAIPIPAALPLLLSGLGVLGFVARRRS